MSSYPVVSVVGKPNTGKSSLFNAIVGRGKSIVFDEAGTTIDINREVVNIGDVKVLLQDTGGYVLREDDTDLLKGKIARRVRDLLLKAVEESDLILFTVTYNEVDIVDLELAKILRKYEDKVKLVVTKVDTIKQRLEVVDEVYRLGFESMYFVSSKTKYGFEELLEAIEMFIVSTGKAVSEELAEDLSIAIVGRVNVGKSSFFNALLRSDRVIVDDRPGTTRDSVDDFLEYGGKRIRIDDTAGFRRSIFKAGKIESFGIERARKSIERCDVAVVVIDGKEGLTKQDKKVMGIVVENYKPYVLCVNKWDLVVGENKINDEKEMKKYQKAFADFVGRTFSLAKYVPIVLVSAKLGYNVDKVLDIAIELKEKSKKRISTGVLNRTLRKEIPEMFSGELSTKLRIYYVTQVEVTPPTFAVFVNKLDNIPKGFENFFIKKVTEIFDFKGVPIKVNFIEKERKKTK